MPATILDDLAAGCAVVVNVSRTIVDDARRRFGMVHVVRVAVDETTLRQRLTARGREAGARIEARIARATAHTVCGPNEIAIDNNGAIEQGVATFIAFLGSLQAVGARPLPTSSFT